MKITSNLNSSSDLSKIIFRDKDSGQNAEVILSHAQKDRLSKNIPDVEQYLQTMFSKYKNDGNIDENSDGYLDASELIYSKRFATLDDTETEIIFSSLDKIMNNKEQAISLAKKYLDNDEYFKGLGAIDGKVLISRDFAEFLSMDKNMDTIISEKESFLDLAKSERSQGQLGLRLAELLLEKLKAWAEEKKRKVLSGISNGTLSTRDELKTKKDISIKEFSDDKRKDINTPFLNKYIDTQADNAKIFSIKA